MVETTQQTQSLASWIASNHDRQEIVEAVNQLPEHEQRRLIYEWRFWARPDQMPPQEDWRGWLLMGGRGSGKTRSGAEWIRLDGNGSSTGPAPDERIGLVAPTSADARDIMVEGESGILATAPPWNRPRYEPSKRRITWPNGAVATTYSAEEPDRLRGPQHTRLWCDEIAAWKYPADTWNNAMLGLRLGDDPLWCATTTPKPIQLIRDLMGLDGVVVTKSTTYDNKDNLAEAFIDEIVRRYEGTRIGRQELMAELLDDLPGALWQRRQLDRDRCDAAPDELYRLVVGVDPATTSGEESDETGIIVAGRDPRGHGYVLDDLSCRLSPKGWAQRVVRAYHRWDADLVVAEKNQGGEMVELTIHTVDPNVPVKLVHASRGKRTRAEPIASKYERGEVHHVGTFNELEDQMCMFTPDIKDSPDRVDAMVWAFTEILIDHKTPSVWVA